MESKNISRKFLKRLPGYLNYLRSLPESTENISATTIAKALNLGDVQVRKDLAKVSDGGRRRTGHSREVLIRDIEEFIGVTSITGAVVVGAGKLGQALLDYGGFEDSGLYFLAGFDIQPAAAYTDKGKPIYPVDQLVPYCQDHQIEIGVLAVPADHAQEACDSLVSCGIRAIWNFAPVHLKAPQNVIVQTENLAVSLTALRMQLRAADRQQKQ